MKADFSEKLIRHRRLFISFIVGLTILLLLILNFGSWSLIKQMGDNLEKELELRLFAIADIAANRISYEYAEYPRNDFYTALLIEQTLPFTLRKIKEDNQLQAVFLIDEDYLVLADDKIQLTRLMRRTDIKLDSSYVQNAWQGLTTVSQLHLLEGNRFKSAYAPIINSDGDIPALLVIEANAHFFDTVQFYQKGLILTVVISVVILIIFSFFLYTAISFLLRNYEAMKRSERLAMMGQMAASVAHEIRNPLSIIKSTGDVLKDMYDDAQAPNELFDFIPSEVKRLNRIVSDLLTFAREPRLELQRIDIRDIVRQVKYEIEQECDNSRITLRENCAANLPSIDIDSDAIRQVLYNMILNSVQAIKTQGTIMLTVTAELVKGNSFIRIEIADDGCGIEEDINKIFDPFFTTKSKGTGLGLAICKQLIENHGGWIEAESEVNVGTKIWFYLPYRG